MCFYYYLYSIIDAKLKSFRIIKLFLINFEKLYKSNC